MATGDLQAAKLKNLKITDEEWPPTPPESSLGDIRCPSPVQNRFPLPLPLKPTEVLEVDKKTPDFHVPRDPRLIRLTGVHPFNVEAPLTELFSEGFLTSPNLFYVRNHGAVPPVKNDETIHWTFNVEG
jgi:nitrate reductase (NAD(P)H)